MGIKPKGTEYVVVPPDNPTTRWGEWEASLEGAGDTAGEVFAETHAIARSAKSTAELAVERAQGYITAAENVTAELAGEIDPEHPDYLLWALANQVDEATHQALRAHSEAISANDIAVQALTRTAALMATVRYGVAYVGEHFLASWNGSTVAIAKRGTWVGDVAVMVAAREPTAQGGVSPSENHTHRYTNDHRNSWLPTDSSGQYTVMDGSDVTILYQMKPGIPKSKSIDSPQTRALANGAWETLAQWVVPSDIQVSASGSFVWANKTYLGNYYARLTLDGVPVTTGEVSSGAPLFGHGARAHQLSMRPRSASRNAVLRLEARASHGNSLNRQVRDVNLTVHWVGQDGDDVETVQITGTSGTESMVQFRQALEDRGLHYSTITEVPFDLDTSGATSLNSMFYDCAALTTVPEMDTSSVTGMDWMFGECSALTSVPDMDTSQVMNMEGMFYGCSALIQAPAMDTSSVTDMTSMFDRCSALIQAPAMDTSSVTDMSYMFTGCAALTDGNVRLIGKHPNVSTTDMITNSGLTREPFFDAAGNPI